MLPLVQLCSLAGFTFTHASDSLALSTYPFPPPKKLQCEHLLAMLIAQPQPAELSQGCSSPPYPFKSHGTSRCSGVMLWPWAGPFGLPQFKGCRMEMMEGEQSGPDTQVLLAPLWGRGYPMLLFEELRY